MYPLNLFTLFPPFPRENKVFVAMSFDRRFVKRWEEVIIPGVKEITVNGTPIEPYRVDIGKGSDSITSEILSGISNCRLFLADITTIGKIGDDPIRNGNVMYEVGIAQAVRLPAEVILFRSDDDPLLFDMVTNRVNYYNPDNEPEEAKQKVKDAIISTGNEINLQKHLSVRQAVDSLDYPDLLTLIFSSMSDLNHPLTRTMRDVLSNIDRLNSIKRLLELGILNTQYKQLTSEVFDEFKDKPFEQILSYKITPFGKAVFEEVISRMSLSLTEIERIMKS